MKIIGLFLISICMLGCATITKPANELRVTEYGGKGSYLAQASGQIAGCRAVQNGAIKGCMVFEGKTCTFKSDGCPSSE